VHYYQRDLALIHDRGYGFHGDRCAPGILDLLAPVRDGLVLELGCGSGALTRHLLAAGLRVIATDASPDMLALARDALGPEADLRELALPGDPLPPADAVVSVGHVLGYLPDAAAIEAALAAAADALRPGGVLAIDILDLDYGQIRAGERPFAKVEADWAIITEFSTPAPDRFVRDATTFVPDGAGAWRRGHERHENVLVDTSALPSLLAVHGVRAEVGTAFGTADLPPGLRSVTGRKDLYRTGPGARPGPQLARLIRVMWLIGCIPVPHIHHITRINHISDSWGPVAGALVERVLAEVLARPAGAGAMIFRGRGR
jgi:SAM-dependent methyltransferase